MVLQASPPWFGPITLPSSLQLYFGYLYLFFISLAVPFPWELENALVVKTAGLLGNPQWSLQFFVGGLLADIFALQRNSWYLVDRAANCWLRQSLPIPGRIHYSALITNIARPHQIPRGPLPYVEAQAFEDIHGELRLLNPQNMQAAWSSRPSYHFIRPSSLFHSSNYHNCFVI